MTAAQLCRIGFTILTLVLPAAGPAFGGVG
jgi:hypothetical protein